MTDTKFTPGPWDNKGSRGQATEFGVFAEGGRAVCSTGGFSDGSERAYLQNKANAHLIAAAPELYNILDQIAKSGMLDGVMQPFADAALAKARGEV